MNPVVVALLGGFIIGIPAALAGLVVYGQTAGVLVIVLAVAAALVSARWMHLNP